MIRPERRRAPRVTYDARIEIEWGSQMLSGRVRDISASGAFIEFSDPLWVHAQFAARLLLDEPLLVNGVVRRVVPGQGMGVEFEALAEGVRERLEGLVSTLTRE